MRLLSKFAMTALASSFLLGGSLQADISEMKREVISELKSARKKQSASKFISTAKDLAKEHPVLAAQIFRYVRAELRGGISKATLAKLLVDLALIAEDRLDGKQLTNERTEFQELIKSFFGGGSADSAALRSALRSILKDIKNGKVGTKTARARIGRAANAFHAQTAARALGQVGGGGGGGFFFGGNGGGGNFGGGGNNNNGGGFVTPPGPGPSPSPN